MSALGQKQTRAVQQVMSALPPKADMCDATTDVRFGPIADIPSRYGAEGACDAACAKVSYVFQSSACSASVCGSHMCRGTSPMMSPPYTCRPIVGLSPRHSATCTVSASMGRISPRVSVTSPTLRSLPFSRRYSVFFSSPESSDRLFRQRQQSGRPTHALAFGPPLD
jgi:hypothetical protein